MDLRRPGRLERMPRFSLTAVLAAALAVTSCGGPRPAPHEIPDDAALTRVADHFVRAASNRAPALAFDGRRLAFLATQPNGDTRLVVADLASPAAPAKAIAGPARSIVEPTFSANGDWLYYREQTATDTWSLFRVRPYGQERLMIAPTQPGRTVQGYQVTPDGTRVVVLEQDAERRTLELSVLGAGGAHPRFVQAFRSAAWLTDVSPDSASALLTLVTGAGAAGCFRVLLDGGGMSRVGPERGAHAGAFALTDAKGTYLSTSGPGGRRVLRRLAEDGLTAIAEYAPEHGSVTRALPGPRGDVVAALVDHGDRTSVALLHADTLEPGPEVALAPGVVGFGAFTPEGDRLLLDWTSVGVPAQLVSVEPTTGAVTRIRARHAPGLPGSAAFEVLTATARAGDGKPVPLHVVLPRQRPADRQLPVVVHLHDGPTARATASWDPLRAFLVDQGLAVVSPNVRGSTGFGEAWEHADDGRGRAAAFADVAAVRDWLRSQSWAHPKRVAVLGEGYGGYLAWGSLTWRPSDWEAGVVISGWADLRLYIERARGIEAPRLRRELGAIGADREALDSLSPANTLGALNAPVLVTWRGQDVHDARESAATLQAAGKRVTVVDGPTEGELIARVTRFLQTTLRLDPDPRMRGR